MVGFKSVILLCAMFFFVGGSGLYLFNLLDFALRVFDDVWLISCIRYM